MAESHGHIVSDSQAQLDLNSLSNLYSAFMDIHLNKKQKEPS